MPQTILVLAASAYLVNFLHAHPPCSMLNGDLQASFLAVGPQKRVIEALSLADANINSDLDNKMPNGQDSGAFSSMAV